MRAGAWEKGRGRAQEGQPFGQGREREGTGTHISALKNKLNLNSALRRGDTPKSTYCGHETAPPVAGEQCSPQTSARRPQRREGRGHQKMQESETERMQVNPENATEFEQIKNEMREGKSFRLNERKNRSFMSANDGASE